MTEATLRAYSAEADRFAAWALQNGHAGCFADERYVDMAMANYIEHEFEVDPRRGRRHRCILAMCGVQHFFPYMQKRFPAAKRALKGWDRLVPGSQYAPMPAELAMAVVFELRRRGHPQEAVAVWLTFHCYLRASEVCGLRAEDVLIEAVDGQAAVRLPLTKTGREQSVTITDPALRLALQHHMQGRCPKGPAFPFARFHLASCIREVLKSWGLEDTFVPLHSLRHGGATTDMLAGVPLEDIIARGRWTSSASTRRYLQMGRTLHLRTQLPRGVRLTGREFLDQPDRLAAYLRRPV